MEGREYLRCEPYAVNVALWRASAADEDGDISLEHEAANLDATAIALAARTSRGNSTWPSRTSRERQLHRYSNR